MHLPNGETRQATSFDANGNILSITLGTGTVINAVYNDVESRFTDIQYPATPAMNIHAAYDAYGRSSSVSDTTGTKTYTYDDEDRLTGVGTLYKNAAGTGNLPLLSLSYAFYPNGSRENLSTPAGSFSYSYDARGLLGSLTNPLGETFGWTYLDNGWMWTQQSGSAFTSTYTYNALGWMKEVANVKNDANHTVLSDFSSIVHDMAGNHLSMAANLPAASAYSGTTAYTQNSLDEVTQEASTRAGGFTNNFNYDGAGNATTFKGAAFTFNTANESTNIGVTFDGEGNPTTWNGSALTFDPNLKLTGIGSALSAGYDITGLRVWKQTASGRTYFLYDPSSLIPVCEVDGSGNVTACNTSSSEGLLARHTYGTGGGSVFYCFDQDGNTAERVDTAGNIASSSMSDAYGTIASTVANTDPYNGFGAQWGYYHDSETGLYLLGERYYDASRGRFLNRDPAFAGGNWFAYGEDNPLTNDDPSGLFCWKSPGQWLRLGGDLFGTTVGFAGMGYAAENPTGPALGIPLFIGSANLFTGSIRDLGQLAEQPCPTPPTGPGSGGTGPHSGQPGTPPVGPPNQGDPPPVGPPNQGDPPPVGPPRGNPPNPPITDPSHGGPNPKGQNPACVINNTTNNYYNFPPPPPGLCPDITFDPVTGKMTHYRLVPCPTNGGGRGTATGIALHISVFARASRGREYARCLVMLITHTALIANVRTI